MLDTLSTHLEQLVRAMQAQFTKLADTTTSTVHMVRGRGLWYATSDVSVLGHRSPDRRVVSFIPHMIDSLRCSLCSITLLLSALVYVRVSVLISSFFFVVKG